MAHFFAEAKEVQIYDSTFTASSSQSDGSSAANKSKLDAALLQLGYQIAPVLESTSPAGIPTPRCMYGTYNNVMELIDNWISDARQSKSSVMWIYGPLGVGKTALANSICEKYRLTGHLAARSFLSVSFMKNLLVPSIAHQLTATFHSKALTKNICKAVVNTPNVIHSTDIDQQFTSLISGPVNTVSWSIQRVKRFITPRSPNGTPRLIVIDGFDALGPESSATVVGSILGCMNSPDHPFRFLLLSRPTPVIVKEFLRWGAITTGDLQSINLTDITNNLNNSRQWTLHTIDLALVSESHIRLYLVKSFEEFKRRYHVPNGLPESWPTREQINRLVLNSSRTFLYPSMVIDFVTSLCNPPMQSLGHILNINARAEHDDDPFTKMDKIYIDAFLDLTARAQSKSQNKRSEEDFKLIFCILAMSTLEFGKNAKVTSSFIAQVIRSLRPDAQIDRAYIDHYLLLGPITYLVSFSNAEGRLEKSVSLYHRNLCNFLQNESRSGRYYVDSEAINRQLLIGYRKQLETSLINLNDTSSPIREISLVFLLLHWEKLMAISTTSGAPFNPPDQFDFFAHWKLCKFEALKGVASIRIMEKYSGDYFNIEVTELSHDLSLWGDVAVAWKVGWVQLFFHLVFQNSDPNIAYDFYLSEIKAHYAVADNIMNSLVSLFDSRPTHFEFWPNTGALNAQENVSKILARTLHWALYLPILHHAFKTAEAESNPTDTVESQTQKAARACLAGACIAFSNSNQVAITQPHQLVGDRFCAAALECSAILISHCDACSAGLLQAISTYPVESPELAKLYEMEAKALDFQIQAYLRNCKYAIDSGVYEMYKRKFYMT